MEFLFHPFVEKRKGADALVVPFWKGKNKCEWDAPIPDVLSAQFEQALLSGDFNGKEGEILYLYLKDQPEKRIILLGLGSSDNITTESFRRIYGALTKNCLSRKLKSLNLIIPKIENSEHLRGIAEGLLLPNYAIDRYKQPNTEDPEYSGVLQTITWIGSDKRMEAIAEKALAIAYAIYYTRDLVNSNADDITPQYLESCARGIVKEYSKVKATLFSKKRIEKENMGLLLAVNRGSALDPAFIILEYKNNPKSKDHTVLVGKGITFDTGGLNIKVAGTGLEIMKCDMGGAAACLGIIIAAATLQLKVNVSVVIPSTENCVDAKSYKPGDVYKSYLGKSVEIGNTDAEGRLILADGLAYAAKNLKPTRLIDIATLTGGMDIVLGPEATGLMSNNEELAKDLIRAGDITFERLWRMPLFEEYKDRLKSDIADIKNWNGRQSGPCVAATFLQEFTCNIPWAHCDIASTAYLLEPKKYLPKYATGVGIRLIIEFLEQLGKK